MRNRILWLLWIMVAGVACNDSSSDDPQNTDPHGNGSDPDAGGAPDTESDNTSDRVSTPEMLERSLMSMGNNHRMKALLEKVANGDEITLAYIGGSITQGYTDTPAESYVVGSYELFKKRFAGENTDNIHWVNAGMGGTPSSVGMLRYEKDVLEKAPTPPDLVVVEFAVNDGDDRTNGAAYESLVRRILLSENKPAVILLFAVFRSHWNLEDRLVPVGEHYNLPMISIKQAVVPELEAETITYDEFFRDQYHPTEYGFQIMSETIDYYFEQVAEADKDAEDITIPEDAAIGIQYTDVRTVVPTTENIPGEMEIELGSFDDKDTVFPTIGWDGNRSYFEDSWHKSTADSNDPFTMNVTCKNLVLTFKKSQSDDFGKAEFYVDGERKAAAFGSANDAWNQPWTIVLLDEETSAPHTLEIKMGEGSEAEKFTVIMIGYTP